MKRTPLRRSGYLKRSTKPLDRGKRLRPQNPERAASERLRDFGPQAEWMRDCRCATCGGPPPSEPSHARSRGAGGDRDDQIPQCARCHGLLHDAGRATFERECMAAWGTFLLADLAEQYAAMWAALPEETRARYVQLFKERWPEAGKLLAQG